MKKSAFAFTSILLAGSLLAFTACGENGSVGKIDGNFDTEATSDELRTALSAIDMDNAFGSSANEELGFQFVTDFTVETNIAKQQSKTSLNLEYSLRMDPEDMAIYGLGKLELSSAENGTVNALSANLYNDDVAVYADLKSDSLSGKFKVSYEDIMDIISGIGGMQTVLDEITDDTEPDETNPGDSGITEIPSLAEGIQMIIDMGFKVYIDDSDGLKIKFEGSEQFVLDMIEEAELPLTGVSFSAFTLDYYLAFDSEGLFTKFGIDADIVMNIEEDSIIVRGGAVIMSYAGEVKLPEGLKQDNYVDFSFGSIM